MKITITDVYSPQYVNEERTEIMCEIKTLNYGEEILPFLATPNDSEEHGRAIFADIVAGVYGEIAEYVPPPPPPERTATPPSGEMPSSVL